MRLLLTGLLLVSAAANCSEDACTYAFRATRFENNAEVTGYGTAVALDLAEYGLDKDHHLLTCAHLVDQYERHRILVETEWRACQVVWKDVELDLCVLRCDVRLESSAKLAKKDPEVGDKISLIGYPRGERSALLRGRVVESVGPVRLQRQAELKGFDHGCSGAGVFRDGKLAGLALGGMSASDGHLVEDLANFLPVRRIRMFLLYASNEKE